MTMRDKIAKIIMGNRKAYNFEGASKADIELADVIIKALPDYDAQEARIKELEAALGEFARFASRKDKNGASVPFGQSKLHAAYAVWKGEKT